MGIQVSQQAKYLLVDMDQLKVQPVTVLAYHYERSQKTVKEARFGHRKGYLDNGQVAELYLIRTKPQYLVRVRRK